MTSTSSSALRFHGSNDVFEEDCLTTTCQSRQQQCHKKHQLCDNRSSPTATTTTTTALSFALLEEEDVEDGGRSGSGSSNVEIMASEEDDDSSSSSSWLQFPSLFPLPPTTTSTSSSETPPPATTTTTTPQSQLPIQQLLPTPSSSFRKDGRPQDITQSTFGPYLLPLADAVDTATGGWGLSYADLSPQSPRTPAGIAFLATNVLYGAVGVTLSMNGDVFYGTLTELAGLVSFAYHYAQLELGAGRGEVRLALLIDYLTAGSALIVGGIYMVQSGLESLPISVLFSGLGAIVCLSLCWVWEYGLPYILWHSLWHVLSAYTAYLVGQVHLDV